MTIRINGTNTTANPGITGADADTGLQFGTNEIELVTGGTARVKIASNGAVQLLSSTGIDFSGIQTNASGVSSEILDSYEEGTWTPTIDSGITSPSITGVNAYYTKIGRLVVCSSDFKMNGNNTGNSNQLKIGGFPFAASTLGNLYGSATINYNNILTGFAELRAGHVNSQSVVVFYNGNSTINGNTSGVSLLNGRRLIMQIIYFTAT